LGFCRIFVAKMRPWPPGIRTLAQLYDFFLCPGQRSLRGGGTWARSWASKGRGVHLRTPSCCGPEPESVKQARGGASQANRRRRGRGKDSSGMYSSQAVGVKTSQTGIRRGVVLGLGHMEASRGGGKPWVRGQLTTSHGHFNFSFSLAHLFSFTSPHRCQPREVVPSGGGGGRVG